MKRILSILQIPMRTGETHVSSRRQQPQSCHTAGLTRKVIAAPTKPKMMPLTSQPRQHLERDGPATSNHCCHHRKDVCSVALHLWVLILFGMLDSDSWSLVHERMPSLLGKQGYGSFHFQSWGDLYLSLKLKKQGRPDVDAALGRTKQKKEKTNVPPHQHCQCWHGTPSALSHSCRNMADAPLEPHRARQPGPLRRKE